MSGFLHHPLASRVGRRIASVAVLSVLVPFSLFGSVIFARARAQADALERQRLHSDTKTAALNGLARLKLIEQGLRWHASQPSTAVTHAPLSSMPILDVLGSATILDGVQPGSAALPSGLTPAQQRHLLEVGAVLTREPSSDAYWLSTTGPAGRVASARVPVAVMFDAVDATSLPPETILCVSHVAEVVGCSDVAARSLLPASAATLPGHGEGDVDLGGTTYFVRTWSLPLESEYGAGVMTVMMLTPRAGARVALRQLERDIVLLAVASLILVILAVLAAVRRTLHPLSALEAAAARVRQQQFDVSLELHTGDEFETLADGFNGMVSAIRAHVADLTAFSVGAATALARTIDAKSPWTSGHSERVTALALEIARALNLPADDLIVLERGGLLHDIGKLATPQEILDKPGGLTPEERLRIEQHPRDGVRILEPIADFAPLLPIVLEHHERFDGAGYPDGKAGGEIHLLARVLAVADVYDALASERPYRAGLPISTVIEHIRAGAGTQFDPMVVEAFLRVTHDGAEIPAAFHVTPSTVPLAS